MKYLLLNKLKHKIVHFFKEEFDEYKIYDYKIWNRNEYAEFNEGMVSFLISRTDQNLIEKLKKYEHFNVVNITEDFLKMNCFNIVLNCCDKEEIKIREIELHQKNIEAINKNQIELQQLKHKFDEITNDFIMNKNVKIIFPNKVTITLPFNLAQKSQLLKNFIEIEQNETIEIFENFTTDEIKLLVQYLLNPTESDENIIKYFALQ